MCHRNTAVSGWIGGTQPGPDLLLQSRTSVRRPQPVRAFVAGTGSTRTFCFGTWHHRHRHRHPQSPMLLLCYSPSCPVTAQSPTAHMHGTAAAHMQCGGQRPGKDSDSGGRMHAWTIDGSLAVALAPAVCSAGPPTLTSIRRIARSRLYVIPWLTKRCLPFSEGIRCLLACLVGYASAALPSYCDDAVESVITCFAACPHACVRRQCGLGWVVLQPQVGAAASLLALVPINACWLPHQVCGLPYLISRAAATSFWAC